MNSRKEAKGRPTGRRKPPENTNKPADKTKGKAVKTAEKAPPVAKPKSPGEAGVNKKVSEPQVKRKVTIEEVEYSDDESSPTQKKAVDRELPFRKVAPVEPTIRPRTTPVPPVTRVTDEAPPTGTGKAYTVRSALDDLATAGQNLDQIMDTVIPMTLGRILALSPALQKKLKERTTRSRVPVTQTELNQFLLDVGFALAGSNQTKGESEEQDEAPRVTESSPRTDVLPSEEPQPEWVELEEDAIELSDLPFDQYVCILDGPRGEMAEGSAIMGDPYLQYLETISAGERRRQVVFKAYKAEASAALRCIFPVINGEGIAESILDSGSQIVSMIAAEATRLGITYDPDIQILMQSANGQVEKTLGLAKDVAFRFGDIIVYLQVHILRQAPYQVLLGRPFDVVTASTVQTQRDGSQEITIKDPRGNERITIPTLARGAIKQIKSVRSTETDIEESPGQDF